MPSNHLIVCHPLLLLPSIFPSIRSFSNESVLCIRWPKYWSFSFSISPSNEYSGLISFRIDWLDLFAVQRTLKSLLQQHSSKASIVQCSAFFIVQLSHPYMTTERTIALTIHTFSAKWCLCFLIWCLGLLQLVFQELYSPWNFPGQNIGVGSLSHLQGIFPTNRSNQGLPHCRWILYQLSHQWSNNDNIYHLI